MVRNVIILGSHIQALGLARQSNAIGVEVILAIPDRYSVAYFSNAVSKVLLYSTEKELYGKICSCKTNVKETLLFPTNDEMIEFLVKYYDEFNEAFYMGIPKPETVTLFSDKRNTYRFCEKNHIACPHSWYPDTIEDVKQIADEVDYPVIIKPSIMYSFHKLFGKKAFRCNDKNELILRATAIAKRFPLENVLIQEFLSGGPQYLYSYGTFAVNGVPRAAIMVNRIRQNPMDFGNSTTFAITCNIPEIKKIAKEILKLTGYFGLAEVEFMYDTKTATYKFIEVNTRAWKWHSISNQLGFGFLTEMIHYYNGTSVKPKLNFSKRVAWTERLTDFIIIMKELMKDRIKWKEVVLCYKMRKEYAVWNSKDMFPFFMYVLLSPILYFKRH
jgi:predicted ATP-grasp superfamily ATP-dependent carboligase